MICCIFAVDETGGMGYVNGLPWPKISEDMRWFKEKTLNQVVVMGANTWRSLLGGLPNRINIVFSSSFIVRNPRLTTLQGDVRGWLLHLQDTFPDKNIMVIGGESIIHQSKPVLEKIYLTRIKGQYKSDVKINIDRFLIGMKLVNQVKLSDIAVVEEYEK